MLAGSSAKTGEVMLLQAHGPAHRKLGLPGSAIRAAQEPRCSPVGVRRRSSCRGRSSGAQGLLCGFFEQVHGRFHCGHSALAYGRGRASLYGLLNSSAARASSSPVVTQYLSSFPPRLESTVSNAIEAAIGRKTNDNLTFGRSDARKATLAAQRYRISAQLYYDIRSKYNVIFPGANRKATRRASSGGWCACSKAERRLELNPDKDAKLWKDPGLGTNIFVRRAAFEEMFSANRPTRKLSRGSVSAPLQASSTLQLLHLWILGLSIPTSVSARSSLVALAW